MRTIMRIYGLSILIFLAGCGGGQQQPQQPSARPEDIYTCSMHPQIIEHHPGHCPICGMELIKKNTAAVATNDIQLETLLRPANQSVISSLAVITPEWKISATPVIAYGTIEYDTRTANTISARIGGRIEKMYIRYRYQEIRKGQKIMDIYSPEIVTA